MGRWSPSERARSAAAFTLICLAAWAAVGHVGQPALAQVEQETLPPVWVQLTVDADDAHGWASMQHEVFATPAATPKPLVVTLISEGVRRSIALAEPKVTSIIRGNTDNVRVIVRGKVSGSGALLMLPSFIELLAQRPAGASRKTLLVEYGLSGVAVSLIEIKIDR